MIVTCPACATTYNLPEETVLADGSVIRCAACGHSWLESRAHEIIDADPAAGDHATADLRHIEAEAERLAAEAMAAEQARRLRRRHRRAETRRWVGLAASLGAVVAVLWAFPSQVVRLAPGAGYFYQALGIEANTHGFTIRKVATSQTVTTSGQLVLAVTGEVTNITRTDRKAPGLVFILLDDKGRKLHQWKLVGVSARAVPAGQPARFVTRIAAPPRTARRVEVRFTRDS